MKIYLAQRLVHAERATGGFYVDVMNLDEKAPLPQSAIGTLKERAEFLSGELDFLGMRNTKKATDRFLKAVDGISVSKVRQFVDDVESRFNDELEEISLFYMEAKKVKYFNHPSAFGEAVFARFPSADYDIREAANCFAFDCYTATVIHSMRVLEVGLSALAKALRVKRSLRGWGTDLNVFNDAWQAQLKSKKKIPGWKRSFFPQAFTEFRYFSDAWRNRAVHAPHAQYGEGESERVFFHVRSFMQHLATRLKEPRPSK